MDHDFDENGSQSWMSLMRQGRYAEAWKFSDKVLESRAGKPCWHLPRHFQYVWDGSSLAGKRVLIRCYHGLGDTIQFIRYAGLTRQIADKVIVWAQPPLIPLLETVNGIDQLLPLHDGTPDATYDVDVEIMELSHVFRTTTDTIPSEIPYLHVEPKGLSTGSETLSVGLVWKAGDWDPRRSIPVSLLAPLAGIPGITFYILQPDARSAGWNEQFGIYPGNYSLFEYAGIIRSLDLLITVDTMAAHLAGALGVTVWNLLHAEADWRWMEQRDDSPWYPTMRLFRQPGAGGWEAVIRSVQAALEKRTKSHGHVNSGQNV